MFALFTVPWESPAQEPDIWRLCHVKSELSLVAFLLLQLGTLYQSVTLLHVSFIPFHHWHQVCLTFHQLIAFFSSSLTTDITLLPTPQQPVTSSFVQFDQPFVFLSASYRQHVNLEQAC